MCSKACQNELTLSIGKLAECLLILLIAQPKGACTWALRVGPVCPVQWRHEYMRLHRSILEETLPPQERRYAIAVASPSGFADRLVGTISVFYFALLTGRAFTLCTGMDNQLPFEAVYDPVHINWTTSSEHKELLTRLPRSATDIGLPDGVGTGYQHWNLVNPDRRENARMIFDAFSHGNLSDLGADKHVLFFTLNRGASVRLFDNPFHAQQLRSRGLTPETAFGCAIDFLFAPSSPVMDILRPTLKFLEPFKTIGIHIRTGDRTFHNGDVAVINDAKRFFICAQQIEADIEGHSMIVSKSSHQEVMWVLLSDSVGLRRQALRLYKEKIYTLIEGNVEHTMSEFSVGRWHNATLSGFYTAASEHWLFGLLDIHIVDHHSGFGRSGAIRTFQDGKMFMIDPRSEPSISECHRDQHLSIRQIGNHHAGA